MSNKELLSRLSTAAESIGLLAALQWPSGGGCLSGWLFPFDWVVARSDLVLLKLYLLSRPRCMRTAKPLRQNEQLNCRGLGLSIADCIGGSGSCACPPAEPAGSIVPMLRVPPLLNRGAVLVPSEAVANPRRNS